MPNDISEVELVETVVHGKHAWFGEMRAKWGWDERLKKAGTKRYDRIERWLIRHGWIPDDYAGKRGSLCYYETVFYHRCLEGAWGAQTAVWKTLELGLPRTNKVTQ